MDRVAKNSTERVYAFFHDSEGAPANPTSPTVTITRDDGTVLVNAQVATAGDETGEVYYQLTPTHLNSLDLLSANWTGTVSGQSVTVTTYVEVVGGRYFPLAQLTSAVAGGSTVYSTQQRVGARTLAETAIEEACGVAFVPRYAREKVSGEGTDTIRLSFPYVRTVRSVKLDGTAVADITGVVVEQPSDIYWSSLWSAGTSNYEVAYEHGHSRPPERVRQAALTLAKNWLVKGPIDDRATAMNAGDYSINLSTPGRGVLFGIPEVDAVVEQYRVFAGVG